MSKRQTRPKPAHRTTKRERERIITSDKKGGILTALRSSPLVGADLSLPRLKASHRRTELQADIHSARSQGLDHEQTG